MKKQWTIDELEAHFTLLPPDLAWLGVNLTEATRLGKAVMLNVSV